MPLRILMHWPVSVPDQDEPLLLDHPRSVTDTLRAERIKKRAIERQAKAGPPRRAGNAKK